MGEQVEKIKKIDVAKSIITPKDINETEGDKAVKKAIQDFSDIDLYMGQLIGFETNKQTQEKQKIENKDNREKQQEERKKKLFANFIKSKQAIEKDLKKIKESSKMEELRKEYKKMNNVFN